MIHGGHGLAASLAFPRGGKCVAVTVVELMMLVRSDSRAAKKAHMGTVSDNPLWLAREGSMQNLQSSHLRWESPCSTLLACMLGTSPSTGGGMQRAYQTVTGFNSDYKLCNLPVL